MATKREFQEQWEAVNNTLADLAGLRCWPADKDIAEAQAINGKSGARHVMEQTCLRSDLISVTQQFLVKYE